MTYLAGAEAFTSELVRFRQEKEEKREEAEAECKALVEQAQTKSWILVECANAEAQKIIGNAATDAKSQRETVLAKMEQLLNHKKRSPNRRLRIRWI